MIRPRLFTVAACAVLCSAAAFAQQTQQNRDDSQPKDRLSQRRDSSSLQNDRQQAAAELPAELQRLDLSSSQVQKIKQTLQENNQQLEQTWQEFQRAHAKTIKLEAAWVAAVRDTLSEEDQQAFDRERRQSDFGTSQFTSRKQEGRSNRDGSSDADRNGTSATENRDSNTSATSPTLRQSERSNEDSRQNDIAEQSNRPEQSQNGQNQSVSSSQRNQNANGNQDASDQTARLIIITTTSPAAYARGANQTGEQQERCSEACRQYEQQLTQAWKNVTRLHGELVQIEADRMQAIEKELTKDQLEQLRNSRQQPSESSDASEGTAQKEDADAAQSR